MFGKFVGIGNLAKNVEVSNKVDGMVSFDIYYKGTRKDPQTGYLESYFMRCVCFGKIAEFAQRYLEKGSKVYVDGNLAIRDYTKRDGSTGKEISTTVATLKCLDERPRYPTEDTMVGTVDKPTVIGDDDDSEIPF